MYFHHLNSIPSKEMFPGYNGKFVHTGTSTIAFWDIIANSPIPEHSHFHEQIMHVIEGEFELTVDGKTELLTAGAVVTIPGNIKHGGKAITNCKVIDVFMPEREEYK
ncbi:cupin domain-containing protein [Lacibacter sp.]|uniref:cupin domain-containing protein n=1 Tax=Lacibacter sp. TaxID=1915409 RepID=UPI002B4B00E3|nr:cupin domain-containing protein [Lacibacter sp.]HLP39047.1 cupin domain-containing protein [Lacibacter sp.]